MEIGPPSYQTLNSLSGLFFFSPGSQRNGNTNVRISIRYVRHHSDVYMHVYIIYIYIIVYSIYIYMKPVPIPLSCTL